MSSFSNPRLGREPRLLCRIRDLWQAVFLFLPFIAKLSQSLCFTP